MKRWMKCICFLLVFVLLFSAIQNVLRFKGEYDDNMMVRYESYITQRRSSIEMDVFYFGSSPIYAGITPIVMWEECGFTGMNFGTDAQNAMSLYYSLLYALDYGTPKVIVLDFSDLTKNRSVTDPANYYVYRKASDTIKSFEINMQYVKDIIDTTGYYEYLFPIIQCHERWSELTKKDFGQYSTSYKEYRKGGLLNKNQEIVEVIGEYDISVSPVDYEQMPFTYYQKLINLCQERKIELVCLAPPKGNIEQTMSFYSTVGKYCDENNIPYFNYNESVLASDMNLNYDTDFYNTGHVNAVGAIKLSRSFANILDALYDLPDRRQDERYASWNEDLEQFHKAYAKQIEQSELMMEGKRAS